MWFSIELQATTPVAEWGGQPVQMAWEEDTSRRRRKNRWARQRRENYFWSAARLIAAVLPTTPSVCSPSELSPMRAGVEAGDDRRDDVGAVDDVERWMKSLFGCLPHRDLDGIFSVTAGSAVHVDAIVDVVGRGGARPC
jgi:hypothetical protein